LIEKQLSSKVKLDASLSVKTVSFVMGYCLAFSFLTVFGIYYQIIGFDRLTTSCFIAAFLFLILGYVAIQYGVGKNLSTLSIVPGYIHIAHCIVETSSTYSITYLWIIAPPMCAIFFIGNNEAKKWLLFSLITVIGIIIFQNFYPNIFPELPKIKYFEYVQLIGQAGLYISLLWIYEQERNKTLSKLREFNQEILEQKIQLEYINKSKDQVFGIISHDLRGPLKNMKAVIDFLRKDQLSTQEKEKMLLALSKSLDQNILTSENLLRWSLMQQKNGIYAVIEDVNVKNIFDLVIGYCNNEINNKKITIVNKVKEEVMVKADINMLEIVLRNLVANAIKFSFEGGIVELHTVSYGDKTMISVRDYGLGVSDKLKNTIFKEFISTPGSNKEKGTGFGLMVCKTMVDQMNGKIYLVDGVLIGSKFLVELNSAKILHNKEEIFSTDSDNVVKQYQEEEGTLIQIM
jgi:signal transduction histidine kinase